MILDANLQLAAAFSPTATGTTSAPNYIDLLAIQDAGMGNSLIWYVQTAAAATSGGAATLDFILQGNPSDPTFASGNVTVVDATQGVLTGFATYGLGFEYKLKYPRGFNVRYLRIQAVIATAVLTGGTFNSWIIGDQDAVQDNRPYAAGYTVL